MTDLLQRKSSLMDRIASHSKSLQHMDALAQAHLQAHLQPNGSHPSSHPSMNQLIGNQQSLSHSQHILSQLSISRQILAHSVSRSRKQSQLPPLLSERDVPHGSSSSPKDDTDLHQHSISSCNFLESGQKILNEKSENEKIETDGGGGDNELREADCLFEMV